MVGPVIWIGLSYLYLLFLICLLMADSLFGWDYSLVNDRKFPAGTVFFSHTKPASRTSSRSSNEQAQPSEQAES